MRYFTQKMILLGIGAFLCIAASIALFLLNFIAWGCACLVFISIPVIFMVCEVRDYRLYKQISADMAGKSLEERLKILGHYEECWLSYASAEEIKFFKDEAAKGCDNPTLAYLVERASFYKKT